MNFWPVAQVTEQQASEINFDASKQLHICQDFSPSILNLICYYKPWISVFMSVFQYLITYIELINAACLFLAF